MGDITCRISPYSTTPGQDDFIIEGIDFTSLSEGQHNIILRATDVNNNPIPDFVHHFLIGNARPYVKRVTIPDFFC